MPKFHKTRALARKLNPLSFRVDIELTDENVKLARNYVKEYWQKTERFHPKDDESLLGLPNPYLVPSYKAKTGFDYNELYYWDSYFMVQGMLDAEHEALVSGILDNLIALFNRFKIIPNASRTYLTGRSQPPLLTSFIFDVYNTYKKDNQWLKDKMSIAEAEYKTVWLGVKKPNERLVYRGLSRYYDINYLHDLAEAESGWDMTPRFDRRALNFLPVDLNALLYKYETDFAKTATILGDDRKAAYWEDQAKIRRQTMDELMWDKLRGLYFDYNFVKQKRGDIASLASYFPLWAGMVDDKRAEVLVKSLKRFEHKGGLSTTDSLPIKQFVIGSVPTQWAYPNGWAPLHFMVIKGLERYSHHKDARRIAIKWLKTNLLWFNNQQLFLEKYNVVDPSKPPTKGLYPSQTGFGWTNSIFERFCLDYIDSRSSS
jgi:alpha,alpha-trehalase